jgi:hypothetical protein
VLALIFARLDRRNQYLVWLGEDVLMHLERTKIFGEDQEIEGRYERTEKFGILWRQAQEERAASDRIRNMLGDRACAPMLIWCRDAWLGKHRVWLRIVSYLVAILFFGAAIFLWLWGPLVMAAKEYLPCPTIF